MHHNVYCKKYTVLVIKASRQERICPKSKWMRWETKDNVFCDYYWEDMTSWNYILASNGLIEKSPWWIVKYYSGWYGENQELYPSSGIALVTVIDDPSKIRKQITFPSNTLANVADVCRHRASIEETCRAYWSMIKQDSIFSRYFLWEFSKRGILAALMDG